VFARDHLVAFHALVKFVRKVKVLTIS